MTDNVDSRDDTGRWVVSRRVLLRSAAAAAALGSLSCAHRGLLSGRRRPLRFGIVTDAHYADADPAGTRFYRASLDKMAECVALMNQEKVEFLIELGDFKDQDRPPVEGRTLKYLEDIEAVFQQFHGPTYHALGNHDVDSISKAQFLARVENTGIDSDRSYYSFDCQGLWGIVLDANYKGDGTDYDKGNFNWTDANIPPRQLTWLRDELAAASGPVVVFSHQLLDGTDAVSIKNASEVRAVLEESGKVLGVFHGHHHAGRYRTIGGIDYYTLKGMIEGPAQEDNAYAIVEVRPDLTICVIGYRKAVGADFESSVVALAD